MSLRFVMANRTSVTGDDFAPDRDRYSKTNCKLKCESGVNPKLFFLKENRASGRQWQTAAQPGAASLETPKPNKKPQRRISLSCFGFGVAREAALGESFTKLFWLRGFQEGRPWLGYSLLLPAARSDFLEKHCESGNLSQATIMVLYLQFFQPFNTLFIDILVFSLLGIIE